MNIDLDTLSDALSTFPKHWDGRTSILTMKDDNYPHWRQMEWIGFYFQYLCDNILASIGMKTPGNKYGRTDFDGFWKIDWDFKSHPIHNKDGKESTTLIANDLEATTKTIEQFGCTGLIVACGEASFDNPDTMPFREWLTDLKGGESDYSLENRKRGAKMRLYKTDFLLKYINIYLLDKESIDKQHLFQKGMRNSNGKPRRDKLSIDLTTITPVKRIFF